MAGVNESQPVDTSATSTNPSSAVTTRLIGCPPSVRAPSGYDPGHGAATGRGHAVGELRTPG